MAFLEWTYEDTQVRVTDGADSYLIEDGKIVAQTIHYTVQQKQHTGSSAGGLPRLGQRDLRIAPSTPGEGGDP